MIVRRIGNGIAVFEEGLCGTALEALERVVGAAAGRAFTFTNVLIATCSAGEIVVLVLTLFYSQFLTERLRICSRCVEKRLVLSAKEG